MNLFAWRRLIGLLRLPDFPLSVLSAIGLAAVFLIWAATRTADAHQTVQVPPTQETPLPQYLNAQPAVDYVDDEVCQNCHPSEYQTFKKTGMGRSASIPSPDDLR